MTKDNDKIKLNFSKDGYLKSVVGPKSHCLELLKEYHGLIQNKSKTQNSGFSEGKKALLNSLDEKERKVVEFVIQYEKEHGKWPIQANIKGKYPEIFKRDVDVNRCVKVIRIKKVLDFQDGVRPKYVYLHENFKNA